MDFATTLSRIENALTEAGLDVAGLVRRLGEAEKSEVEDIPLDDDRLAKEVAFFAERSDFSEEVSRLESHITQFLGIAESDDAIGRTLEFLCQEIGRELNTLSAKANDAEISQLVVHSKAELEKIREQVSNVE